MERLEEKRAKKIAFFTDLYDLDLSDEDSEDRSYAISKPRKGKSPHQVSSDLSHFSPQQKLSWLRPSNHPTSHTLSASALPRSTTVVENTSPIKPTPTLFVGPTIKPILENQKGMKKSLTMNKRKRKRGQPMMTMSESQQIFRGLAFCNNLHPALV